MDETWNYTIVGPLSRARRAFRQLLPTFPYFTAFIFPQISKMMFARVFSLACLALGAEAFFMGTPLRTSMRVGSSRTSFSMKVPTDHPEIEVRPAAVVGWSKKLESRMTSWSIHIRRLAWCK